jgi:hypothetical protein
MRKTINQKMCRIGVQLVRINVANQKIVFVYLGVTHMDQVESLILINLKKKVKYNKTKKVKTKTIQSNLFGKKDQDQVSLI